MEGLFIYFGLYLLLQNRAWGGQNIQLQQRLVKPPWTGHNHWNFHCNPTVSSWVSFPLFCCMQRILGDGYFKNILISTLYCRNQSFQPSPTPQWKSWVLPFCFIQSMMGYAPLNGMSWKWDPMAIRIKLETIISDCSSAICFWWSLLISGGEKIRNSYIVDLVL